MEIFTRVQELLAIAFDKQAIITVEQSGLQPALVIHREKLAAVCLFLRDHEETYFDFLSCISAVDDGVESGSFSVVYHLASLPHQHQLTLKVTVDNDRRLDNLPVLPTVTNVWRTADWHEREA